MQTSRQRAAKETLIKINLAFFSIKIFTEASASGFSSSPHGSYTHCLTFRELDEEGKPEGGGRTKLSSDPVCSTNGPSP